MDIKTDEGIKQFILDETGADSLGDAEPVQELWSGYGSITRYTLINSSHQSIIVKHVALPSGKKHPRGWNTDLSHKRKVRSYEVEKVWYKKWAGQCNKDCRVPQLIALKNFGGESVMLLEDLNAAGFTLRRSSLHPNDMTACLKWLANFHAVFMGQKPDNLWKRGTYWHLDTRPDEFEALKDGALKNAAKKIDAALNGSPYQTIVHGDAKLANFCFSRDGEVSAVDFQYVGGGCGVKDVAYFIGSCLGERECEKWEKKLLDIYFDELSQALKRAESEHDPDNLIRDWRKLFHVAWADFHRFIKGWSPGHWKINDYSERITRKVIESL